MKHQGDELDRWLDRSLNEYSQAPPRSGLEQRILANLAAEPGQNRWRRLVWVATPTLACAAVVLALLLSPKPEAHVSVAAGRSEPSRTVPNEQPPTGTLKVATHPHQRTRRGEPTPAATQISAPPRLATFPSRDGDDELIRMAMHFAQLQPVMAEQITKEQHAFRETAQAFTAPLNESSKQTSTEER